MGFCRFFVRRSTKLWAAWISAVMACSPARIWASPARAGEDAKNSTVVEAVKPPTSPSGQPLLLPIPGLETTRYLAPGPAGRLDWAAGGARVTLYPDGSFRLGADWLSVARNLEVLRLPLRLGGGYAFSLSSQRDLWLMRASDFTEPLLPIGRIDVPVDEVVAGFEGIYVRIRDTGLIISIDPVSRDANARALLPPAPEYGSISVADDWFGAVADPLRGVLFTRDGGHRYWPTGLPGSAVLDVAGDAVVARLESNRSYLIEPDGTVREIDEDSIRLRGKASHQLSSTAWQQLVRRTSLGTWPIQAAVTEGVTTDGRTALVLVGGVLARVSLNDGRVVRFSRVPVPTLEACPAVRLGAFPAFVCAVGSSTQVFMGTPETKLRRLAALGGNRPVVHAGPGGMILRGPCGHAFDPSVPAQAGTFCRVGPAGSLSDIRLGAATGEERLGLLARGTVAVLIPPNSDNDGRLQIGRTSRNSHRLKLPADASHSLKMLLTQGQWLQAMSSTADGLCTWVVGGEKFAGVTVGTDGSLEAGPVQSGADHALFADEHALVPTSAGFALESVDCGRSWRSVGFSGEVAEPPSADSPRRNRFYGCTSVGCQIDNWLRVGWTHPKSVGEMPDQLQPQSPDPPPFLVVKGRQRQVPHIACTGLPGSRTSAVAARSQPRNSSQSDRRRRPLATLEARLASARWRPFYGQEPPRLESREQGIDRTWRDDRYFVMAYARVGLSPAQELRGGMRLRVMDQLGSGEIWSTAIFNLPFADPESVSRAMRDPRYGSDASRWSMVFDPGGRAGMLSINDGGSLSAYLFEPGSGLKKLPDLGDRDPRHITDLVRTERAFYLLGTEPKARLFEVREGVSRVISTLDPRTALSHGSVRLVRDTTGRRLGYLTKSARLRTADVEWFVYPIDADTGTIEPPVPIPLDRGLYPCDSLEQGWLLPTDVESLIDLTIPERNSDLRVLGLLIASSGGVCVAKLALLSRELVRFAAEAPSAAPIERVPAVSVDNEGRRSEFSCALGTLATASRAWPLPAQAQRSALPPSAPRR